MLLKDFDFNLPKELIAQYPRDKRDESDLLIISNSDNNFIKTKFSKIIDYLEHNDVLVLNNSMVINAKLILQTANKNIECYINKHLYDNVWHAFAKPSRKLNKGDIFYFDNHQIIIKDKLDMGQIEIEFKLDNLSTFEFLEIYGSTPLPPYIKRDENADDINIDKERYQTVYGLHPGSVAAHTAGLHFTNELLEKITAKGIQIAFVTLHIGAGTFLPIKTDNIQDHKMHEETYYIDEHNASIINKAKLESRRVIAVGTTSLRVLESNVYNRLVKYGSGKTNLFITPNFKFQIADMLISNFHLPKSTLFILLCAFIGQKKALKAYDYAIKNNMRFFSYGDATLSYLQK